MKTAVIYARYSCDKQTEQSIEGQIRVCKEYAEKNNILIVGQYIDQALSGTTDKRPEFRKMLDDSKNKKWNYILVYRLDRFSRDVYDSVIHEQTLNKLGIKLISATEIIPETSEGGILKGVIQLMNDYYVKELRQKVKRGMRETRLKGYFQGGTVLYGYKLDGRKLVIDEEKANIVKYIFEQYASGIFVHEIIKDLTSKGILNKNKPFARNIVYCILKNEKYSGVYRHEDEVIENMYPQIISPEIYEKVRKKVESNKLGTRSVRLTYLFRHKMICGYCGMPICAECGNSRNGTKLCYYKCSGRKKKINTCLKKTEKKEILEDYIVKSLISKLKNTDIMNNLIKTLLKIQNNQTEYNTILQILKKEKSRLNSSLENILSAIECGVFNNTTNKTMKEIEERLKEIEHQILIEQNKEDIKLTENDIKKYYQLALTKESKVLVDYLIKEIKLFDDKIEITLNNPLRSPDNQGFSFYKKLAENTESENLYLRLTLELFV